MLLNACFKWYEVFARPKVSIKEPNLKLMKIRPFLIKVTCHADFTDKFVRPPCIKCLRARFLISLEYIAYELHLPTIEKRNTILFKWFLLQ